VHDLIFIFHELIREILCTKIFWKLKSHWLEKENDHEEGPQLFFVKTDTKKRVQALFISLTDVYAII